MLCTHFFSKENTLKFRFVKPQKGELKELFHLGSERVVARTLNFIRPLMINPLVLMLGGTPAMAALSIRNSLMSFVSIPGYGISDGVSVTADIANNLKSRIELKETGRLAHRYAAVFELFPGILLCALSVPIAMFCLPGSTGAERAILVFALGIRRWHLYGLLAAWRGRACFPALHVGAKALSEIQKDLAQRFPDLKITLSPPNETGAGGAFPIADSAGRFFVEPDGCAPFCPGKDPKRPPAEELGNLCSSRYV